MKNRQFKYWLISIGLAESYPRKSLSYLSNLTHNIQNNFISPLLPSKYSSICQVNFFFLKIHPLYQMKISAFSSLSLIDLFENPNQNSIFHIFLFIIFFLSFLLKVSFFLFFWFNFPTHLFTIPNTKHITIFELNIIFNSISISSKISFPPFSQCPEEPTSWLSSQSWASYGLLPSL